MSEMTPEEQKRAEEMLAELHERGYRDVEQHGKLRAGVRVRHVGHRWPEAYENGTGGVVAITEKPNSAWSLTYGKPDIEMVVLLDAPSLSGSRLSGLAQYHVEVIGGAS
jgi:hypothetical protein